MFYDRLVDDQDRTWLFSFVRDVTKTHLAEDFDRLFINLDSNGDGKVTEDDLRSLMFCDFSDAKSDAKNYIEIKDLEQLRHVVENYLDEYNNLSKKPMNLVMFRSLYFFNNFISFSIVLVSWLLPVNFIIRLSYNTAGRTGSA